MPAEVRIRPETASDHKGISDVHVAAFANHPFSHQTEHLIVETLRGSGALCISLVAEANRKVVGHIAFSRVTVDGEDPNWYALGPVGVLPPLQRQGIGSQLVRDGLEQLRRLGAGGCVLIGEPSYYSRFGFRPCRELTMEGVPADVLQCLPLAGPEPHGRVEHHPAFWVQPRSASAT